jgi:23S rRNA (pseudouridine1915-N3)-methyltransferase
VKIFLYYIGKAKDPHANALAADYVKRTSHYCATTMAEIRPGRLDLWEKHPTAKKILLDPAGKTLDSRQFSRVIGYAGMVFLIGGHDGLPAGWRGRADVLLSLSAMTMPHELARAVLAEQIYRGFAILNGHPYVR